MTLLTLGMWIGLFVWMNITLAHISLPFYLNRSKSTHGYNSERTWRNDVVDLPFAPYVDGCVLLEWMSCLLTFPCRSVRSGTNELEGTIPSELGELTSLTELWLRTCICLSCWHECHACSHFPPCHSIWTGDNQLTGSIPSELGGLTSLAQVFIGTWIGLVCFVRINVTLAHICLPVLFGQIKINSMVQFQANSENLLCWVNLISVRGLVCLVLMNVRLAYTFIAVLFEQIKIYSPVQFRANSENLRRWVSLILVRALVCLIRTNVTLAHICLPFCSIRAKCFHWRPRSDLLSGKGYEVVEFDKFWIWLPYWSCVQLLLWMLLMRTRGRTVSATRIILETTVIWYINQ
jgi:hypothetical protein